MPSPQIKIIRVRNLPSSGGGGTPGGSDTQMQFNDSGAFSGDARLIFDKINGVLKTIGGISWHIRASGSGFGIDHTAYLDLGNTDVSIGPAVVIEFEADDGTFDITFNGSGVSSYPDTLILNGSGAYPILLKNTDLIFEGGGIRGTNSCTFDGPVQVNDKFTLSSPGVPNAANAAGVAGRISWDANFTYVCVATNTWKRAALSTW